MKMTHTRLKSKVWSSSQMAPKPKKALGWRVVDRKGDSKWPVISTFMPPFSRPTEKSVLISCDSQATLRDLDGYLVKYTKGGDTSRRHLEEL